MVLAVHIVDSQKDRRHEYRCRMRTPAMDPDGVVFNARLKWNTHGDLGCFKKT